MAAYKLLGRRRGFLGSLVQAFRVCYHERSGTGLEYVPKHCKSVIGSSWYKLLQCHDGVPIISNITSRLEDIAEVRVLTIRKIIETMRRIDVLSKLAVLLVVAVHQVPPQEQDNRNQNTVASEMDGQSLDVARRIAVEEDLGSGGVSGAPREEVHGDADGFLGLTADVAGQQGHAETLRGPEGEDDPIGDQKPGAGGMVGVLDGHDYDRADEGAAIH